MRVTERLTDIPMDNLDAGEQTACAAAKLDARRLLANRARRQADIRRRLGKRYLDDEAFAREWRGHRVQRRPRGREVIEEELRQLGVDAETVREALEYFDGAANAYKAAYLLAIELPGNAFL